MPPFVKNILDRLKALSSKLDTTKKIILGSAVAVVVVALVIIGNVSSEKSSVVLFKGMDTKDFASVTTKLGEMGFHYTTSGTDTIYISPDKKNAAMVALAQENLIPQGVHGWDLFDIDKWSETQFEKDIKKQRALSGAIAATLKNVKGVEKAQVNLAFPTEELFQEKTEPVTAAILLEYKPGVEKLTLKEIRGIENLVSRSVPGLKKEHITIAGPDGETLNEPENDSDREKSELKNVEAKLRIQESQRTKLLADIRKSLTKFYGEGVYGDRYDVVRLEAKLRWDKEELEKNEVEPVVMTPDDPRTPYSERVVKDSLEVSSKTTTEEFDGNGFTPEGPAGTEPNIPPGYKDRDYQKAKYIKKEEIKNNKFNETHRKIRKQPWELERVNLAVLLDGKWERLGVKADQSGYDRKYLGVTDEELLKVTDVLKKSIGFDIARGDQISVKHLQIDRSKQFEAEDEELRAQIARRKLLIGILITLIALAIAYVAYIFIKREIERRRRLREEELAARQAMMRDAALRAIEEEGVEVELSIEEQARRAMIENAINLAKERPEDVVQLLRTWLSED